MHTTSDHHSTSETFPARLARSASSVRRPHSIQQARTKRQQQHGRDGASTTHGALGACSADRGQKLVFSGGRVFFPKQFSIVFSQDLLLKMAHE